MSVVKTEVLTWKKPYIEALVERLGITSEHDVLEIGFGEGYATEAIQYYNPKSHTIINLDKIVLDKSLSKKITVKEDDWQDLLKETKTSYSRIKKYDRIYYGDFPSNTAVTVELLNKLLDFLDRVMLFHCNPGAKITFYLEVTLSDVIGSSKQYKYDEDRVHVYVPETCTYLKPGARPMYLPLITLL